MKTVGKQLEEGRLDKKWTPEMAARETKIRVDRLLDLESDNFSNFSNPTYARGFVRTYARALNLDEYRLLRQLDQKLPEWDGTLMSDTGVVYMTQSPEIPIQQPRGNKLGSMLLWGLCLASCVVIALILYANYVNTPDKTTDQATPTPQPQVTDTPTATPAPVAVAVSPDDIHQAPIAPPVAGATTGDPGNMPNIPVAPVAGAVQDTTPTIAAVVPAASPVPSGAIDPNSIPVAPAVSPDASPTPTPTPAATISASSSPAPTDAAVAPRALAVDPAELAREMNQSSATTPTPVPTPEGKPLTLTAHGDCYVTVKQIDSHDRAQLIYKNEIHAGDSVDFDGKKFRVKLSDPALIDVSVLGSAYSHHNDHDEETFDVIVHP